MQYNYRGSKQDERHKLFISYYHNDDQYYRDKFEKDFSHLFISKSVKPGDIKSDLSDEYIKRLIQENYITDSSIVLVLVGPKTRCRKHVDWEISAGLNKKLRGYSGLIGILLPSFNFTSDGGYYYHQIPDRLADNIKSGYSGIYTWDYIYQNYSNIRNAIHTAFNNRINAKDKIDNSRKQLDRNLCS